MPLLLLLAVVGLCGCKFSLYGDPNVNVNVPEDAGIAFVQGYWEYQQALVQSSCGGAPAADKPDKRVKTPPPQ